MKIAYLDPHPVPDAVTVPLQILQMVDAFGNGGAEVHLITPQPAHTRSVDSILGHSLSTQVQLHHLPDLRHRWWFPSGSNRPYYWMASRLLARLSVDLLFIRNIRLAARLLQDKRVQLPLFFETHELFANTYQEEHPHPSWQERRKWQRLAATEALVYQKASALISLTPFLLQDIERTYATRTPSLAAPLGFDATLAQQALATPRPTNPQPVLLYLGNLHPWKGVPTLLQAMTQVEGAVLRIIGGNPERNQLLQQQAEQLAITDKIQLLPPVPPAQRFHAIHAADICLLPLSQRTIASRYTSPLKLFEYMAMGKAIITADLPSMRLLLQHDRNALLTEVGDPAALAAAIRSLLADPATAQRLATAAQQLSLHHTWNERAKRMLAFMEERLNQR
ncbi:MAG: glycosyltransferase family 4 protein [Magnetococcales bacterium]|nr:glycosyltransferase family 4 protein [Magnetococcales bacterium]